MLLMTCLVFCEAVRAQNSVQTDALETLGSGNINWTTGEVYATGIGAPPPHAVNAAQSRAMAERAARVVAYRNLLEAVKGVRVDSETVVENFMTKSDVIRTRVDGIVNGARIIKTNYMSDGAIEVIVAMPMRGEFLNTVVPPSFGKPAASPGSPKPATAPSKSGDAKLLSTPAQPSASMSAPEGKIVRSKSEPTKSLTQSVIQPQKRTEPSLQQTMPHAESTVAFKGGVATGLVIDGRGLGLRPALLPKIFDQQGEEIYVGQVVARTNAVEQGVAGYARDVNAAANNFRVTDNPAIIRGLRAAGTARTDVVVGQADAQTLRQLSSKGEFLQFCRVIIVY